MWQIAIEDTNERLCVEMPNREFVFEFKTTSHTKHI